MLNIILTVIASILLLLGFISMLTPIPGGILMIAGGLTTLICSSPRAQLCIKYMRTRLNWFNKTIYWIESKVGSRIKIIGNALKKTRPEEESSNCPLNVDKSVN